MWRSRWKKKIEIFPTWEKNCPWLIQKILDKGWELPKKITISVLGEKKSHIPWEEKNASSNSISNEMYIQGMQDKKESSWVFHMVHRNSWINHEDHKITMRKKLQYFWPVFFFFVLLSLLSCLPVSLDVFFVCQWDRNYPWILLPTEGTWILLTPQTCH